MNAPRTFLGVAALSLAVFGCKSSVDPNQGRFSCATDADCGDGYECRPQFAGGGRCFKLGECTDVELCNGLDDNCDGRVDESFPGQGDACATGQLGPCAAGLKICSDAGTPAVACARTYTPVAETCNQLDDDCSGQADEPFNLMTDDAHCGACAHACPGGSNCRAAVCVETNCADGVDNDLDGGADCADPACRTVDCGGDGGFNCGQRLDPPDAGDGGLDGGPVDGGTDAGQTDGGLDGGLDAGLPLVPACVERERVCDDGLDDDFDGLVDCADFDCEGLTCRPGKVCSSGQCPN